MVHVGKSGAEIVAELGGRDLNRDGKIINLVICETQNFMTIHG